MSATELDYAAYSIGHNSAGATDIEELIELAKKQYGLELEIDKLEETLKLKGKELRDISENLLPEKMEHLGLPSFSTKDGMKISIKDDVRAHISQENKPKAHDWLEKNGAGAIIKSQVVTAFGREEINRANALVEKLRAEGLPANLERSVHTQTLWAFMREALGKGVNVPVELFGVQRIRSSKVKMKVVDEA
jgi:hypothetical protein